MLDVGLAVDRPELELVVAQAERSAPVLPLDAGKADFFLTTAPITGDVDPLGARVRYQPFEPMAVLRQRFPGEPGYARRRERLGAANLIERQPDALAQLLDHFPVGFHVTELMIGDDLLCARLDDLDPRLPIRAVGRDGELEDRVTLPCVETMLLDERLRALERHRFVVEASPSDMVVEEFDGATELGEAQACERDRSGRDDGLLDRPLQGASLRRQMNVRLAAVLFTLRALDQTALDHQFERRHRRWFGDADP